MADAVGRDEAEPAARERRRHEEDEERADPVVREPLPHLGEEQRREAARMAEEAAVVVSGLAGLVVRERAASVWRRAVVRGHVAMRVDSAAPRAGRSARHGFSRFAGGALSSQLTVVGGCLMHAAQ